MRFFSGLVLLGAMFGADAQNLYEGDTSAEVQTDTLTRGTYSAELLTCKWDDTTAFDGKKSIRVDWIPTTKHKFVEDKRISVADTPDLKSGETYTFSFYAKASSDNYPVLLQMLPTVIDYKVADGTYNKVIKLDQKWQRYSLTFVAKINSTAVIKSWAAIFNFSNSPKGSVWYDAIQLEAGIIPTPYKTPSPLNVGVSLNSSSWSNIYFPDESVIATLRFSMPDNEAELQCNVVDYQGKIVKDFKKAVKGTNEIKFPLELKNLGWFKVTATIASNGKIMSSHSVNYIKITKPVEIVKDIQPFSGINNLPEFDQFDIFKKIGVKRVQACAYWHSDWTRSIEISPGNFDWSGVEWELKRGKEFGMLNKIYITPFSPPEWYLDKKELTEAKKSNSYLVLNSDKHEYWRKFIGELTRRYGDLIDELELGSEDNGSLGINEYYKARYPQEVKRSTAGSAFLVGGKPFDDLCEMVKIGAAEIRKTHPNMRIGAIRPSEGRPGDDWLFVRAMFKKVGKDFNIFPLDCYVAPYTYGPLIKIPRSKVDDRFETFSNAKKITEELGCNQPIYISESGLFPDVRFPDDSMYRQEQAEFMAKEFITTRVAGFYAYDWFLGFGGSWPYLYNFQMQQNMKIQSVAAAYSAVAQVVENVTESKWLAPDSVTRIAIMKKHDSKGVAAVWADKGYKVSLPEIPGMIITDLMGNPITSVERQFTLSQAPIYIWHNNFKQLSDILAKAEIEMTEFCDIKFRMLTESTGRLQFVNLSKIANIEINAEITLDEKCLNRTIDVMKDSYNTCDIPLSDKRIKVKASTNRSKTILERIFELDSLTPIVAGSKTDILIAKAELRGDIYPPSDPWVSWSGPDDLSVQIFSSWNTDNLYIKAKVKDDLHFNKFLDVPWCGDSLQVAIDPRNNGAFYIPVAGKPLDSDDFEFALALGNDDKTSCISSYGKDICKADNYKILRDEKEKTTTYELRLPWKELGVKPSNGMIFGMSFVVFDDDTGLGQNYYAPLGNGIAGTKNPALYKKFILKQ